ncbi:hypothetical protein Pcinc_007145 [Petrolisthes cinctipes]|uniref:Uncharacterized protein n=1 Tax=Petrolisthes cinctipes TaxID=88211 RepID=A0AAE1GBG4_PETCI|nr:hypothetical protein Pcinc_007145 [Petrolisthes cinctipes]
MDTNWCEERLATSVPEKMKQMYQTIFPPTSCSNGFYGVLQSGGLLVTIAAEDRKLKSKCPVASLSAF